MDKDPLPMTAEKSALRDSTLPLKDGMQFRASRQMRTGIVSRALTEKLGESAIIRRWIRLGAAMEGHDITSW